MTDRPIDPNTGKPVEKRSMGDFERDMLAYMAKVSEHMGEVRQYMANQSGRCASHSASIADIKEATDEIKLAIEYKADPTDENPNIGTRVGNVEAAQGNYKFSCGVGVMWLTGLTAALAALWDALFTHAANNPEATRHAAEAIKRMKGGG